jgi:hypothetical protein
MDKEQRIAHLSKGFTKTELIDLIINREDELEHALQERNKYAEENSALKQKMPEVRIHGRTIHQHGRTIPSITMTTVAT